MKDTKPIPYSRQYIEKDEIQEITKVLKSDWITQGPKIREFEDALCSYTGARYAVAVSSGTAALHIACLAAEISGGSEVISSPITFAASSNCVLYCGGRPVFADIETDTANIDPIEIERHITGMTKAIIPVHFAGHPAALERINAVAKKNNLIVIEDAAHALGATYQDTKIGSCRYSDMTVFSFHPVKSITTGEGGAVLTNSKELYRKLLMLRNHGITKDGPWSTPEAAEVKGPWYYEQQFLGFNYRITDIQCAMGIIQMKRLDSFIRRRREIATEYNKVFSGLSWLELPRERNEINSAWHLYPVRVNKKAAPRYKRKKVFNQLRQKGLLVQVHYIPVYLHPYYESLGYRKGICPKAEDFYEREISIPLHPSMKNKDVRYVIETVKGI
ncbi:MAG: UDP-4-amino-4,6-dideoxy-N-acetyl-beta-L-altrosamine transaminase [Candidatus Omnitrophica bacterium]|nr:UDP-4-amino-4,6-dideoxy-N-acetyl-beta-L-altrosamine transaminase [Candidatus Omnitrophota bacterium]